MIHKWLELIRDDFRSSLSSLIDDPNHNIRVMPDGQPIATSSPLFIAIWSPEWVNPDPSWAGNEFTAYQVYGVTATISLRIRSTPHDREGTELFLKATSSLSRIALEAQRAVSNNILLKERVHAAAQLELATANVIEPMVWHMTTAPKEQPKSWFYSNDRYDNDRTPAGYSIDVVFRGGMSVFEQNC